MAELVDNYVGCVALGVLVPKRHARRAVTRNLIRRLARAIFSVNATDLPAGRWLIRLKGPAPALDPRVPADIRQAIENLPDRWVFVPNEARNGLTLPLKLETLTGRIRYFYTDDPRSAGSTPQP